MLLYLQCIYILSSLLYSVVFTMYLRSMWVLVKYYIAKNSPFILFTQLLCGFKKSILNVDFLGRRASRYVKVLLSLYIFLCVFQYYSIHYTLSGNTSFTKYLFGTDPACYNVVLSGKFYLVICNNLSGARQKRITNVAPYPTKNHVLMLSN